MRKFLFILFVALGIYYYVDTMMPKPTLTLDNTTYNLIRVNKTKQGYYNQFVKQGYGTDNWDKMVSISTFENTKDHKQFIESMEKMVRGNALRVSSDYRTEYSMLMFCLDSNGVIKNTDSYLGLVDCAYIKAENKYNQVYTLQYSVRYPLDNGRDSVLRKISKSQRQNFDIVRNANIPFIAKQMPSENGFSLPFAKK